MKATSTRCAASSRGRQRFQPSWLSPGLTSHQQLDAGIAARQQAGRKALKKSKRPFDNYFRTQFRFSPRVRESITNTAGVMTSSSAVRMMTDPTRSWRTPWDRGGDGATTRRKRQDVLEPTPTLFGEDAVDRVVERLLEIRFAWDREDGVLCTSLVPDTLYSACTHCRPYVAEVAAAPLSSSPSTALTAAGGSRDTEEDGEVVMIAGVAVRVQRRTPLMRQKTGQPKRPHAHSSLGFSGVDTVPSFVLDVSHGPFVTAPTTPLMTLRWKGEHRDAATAQSTLQLLRRVRSVPVVGLSPRSSLLLLKALATVEVEEPALAVSLAIAIGENYNGYSNVECLEVLRCLRRLAFVRGLPDLHTPDINALALSAAGGPGGAPAALPALYTEAALTDPMLSQMVNDAAPFLIGKVWSRVPEQSRHLLERGYYLDWFDLMRLAIASSGPQRLPERLPNPVTEAPYAAKYLFFHRTLGLRKRVLRAMVAALRDTPLSASAADSHVHHQHTVPSSMASPSQSATSPTAAAAPQFVDDVKEEVDKPLVLWLCASLLVRIVAECLGDVVRHVGDLLHQHAALAAERVEGQTEVEGQEEEPVRGDASSSPPPSSSRQLLHPYPRFSSGSFQQIGCRKPKRVRVRLLPFEAFPRVAQCFSCPFASVTERAEAQERQRRQRSRQRETTASAAASTHERTPPPVTDAVAPLTHAAPQLDGSEVQSSFAAVLAESPRMIKQVQRVCAALRWSTMVLKASCDLVRDLPVPAAPPLTVSAKVDEISKESAEWARETVAMEVRHALCYRYVRSAVQLHMDALFTFIPWGELEEQWTPMLTAGSEGGGEEEEEADAKGEMTGDEVEGKGVEGEAVFTATALDALLTDDAVAVKEPHAERAGADAAPLSEVEQRARAMMEELRECMEEFQVVVADVLDAHERFFEAPKASTTAASS